MRTPEQIANEILSDLDLGGDLGSGTPKTGYDVADSIRSGWLDGDSIELLIERAVVLAREDAPLEV